MSSDVWLEPEFWADYGHLDELEKNESYILKNDLFAISPKKGCLESGSHVSIMITYKLVNSEASSLNLLGSACMATCTVGAKKKVPLCIGSIAYAATCTCNLQIYDCYEIGF